MKFLLISMSTDKESYIVPNRGLRTVISCSKTRAKWSIWRKLTLSSNALVILMIFILTNLDYEDEDSSLSTKTYTLINLSDFKFIESSNFNVCYDKTGSGITMLIMVNSALENKVR